MKVLFDLVQRSLAPGTFKFYSRVWKDWFQMMDRKGVRGMGHELQDLCLEWVAGLLEAGVSVSGMDKRLAALAFLCKMLGWPDVTKMFVVRQALKGLRKGVARVDKRRPVSWDLLRAIMGRLSVVCPSGYEQVLFKAAFALAFYGAFRLSELVSPNRHTQGGVGVGEVCCSDQKVVVWVRKSKTDQLGRGVEVVLHRLAGCVSCPVGAVSEFLKVRQQWQGAFLVHEDGTPLSRFQFIAIFRKCLEGLQVSVGDYGSHSFRIGAATEAVRLGLPQEVVKRIGRWESQRFLGYVRLSRVESV